MSRLVLPLFSWYNSAQCVSKERKNMNTITSIVPVVHTRQYFQEKEAAVLHAIPGMDQLIASYSDERQKLEVLYPDAAFALKIVSDLFFPDRELAAIHMEAYSAILNGENIPDIRFRYQREMDAYHQRHLWD